MKFLSYQMRLILFCIVFGGVNFGFHVWVKEPLGKAAGEATLTTLLVGILIHYKGTLKKIDKR